MIGLSNLKKVLYAAVVFLIFHETCAADTKVIAKVSKKPLYAINKNSNMVGKDLENCIIQVSSISATLTVGGVSYPDVAYGNNKKLFWELVHQSNDRCDIVVIYAAENVHWSFITQIVDELPKVNEVILGKLVVNK